MDAESREKSGREKINAVSPSFCMAKWLQVTIDLVNGTNHSCHHPQRHAIPLDELKKNPSALHNTAFKKEQRKMMLEGVRPPECNYCWQAEDAGVLYSDRIIKSTDPWSWPEFDKVKSMPWDQDVNPTFLEVMFDDLCNFSCAYCKQDISTGVASEIKSFGAYKLSTSTNRYASLDELSTRASKEPYLEAFWKWFPEVLRSLKVLRVTGGEPLLSKDFNKLLEYLVAHPQPNLEFAVNSHLGHSRRRMGEFVEVFKKLRDGKTVKNFEIYTSVDTAGEDAEFIRHGLDYSLWLENMRFISEKLPQQRIVIMCTFNILSILSFPDLLKDVVELKKLNPSILIDISFLRDPFYLRADIADEYLMQKMSELPSLMESYGAFFSEHEVKKMKNVVSWAQSKSIGSEEDLYRINFFKFIFEYGRRKNKDPLAVLEKYKDFFALCKKTAFANLFTEMTLKDSVK